MLLSIAAAWCRWCHEMDRTSYADPVDRRAHQRRGSCRPRRRRRPPRHQRALQPRRLADDRVSDARRRRFSPAAPSCRPIGWRGVLAQVADAFDAQPERRADARGRGTRLAGAATPRPLERGGSDVADLLRRSTRTTAASATEPKFPLVAPLQLALESVRRDPRRLDTRRIVVATLDAMGWGGLYDERGRRVLPLRDDARLAAAARREAARGATRRCSGLYLDAGEQPRNSRGSPSAAPTRCATCRPGSPIRSTAGGGDRRRPTTRTTPPIRVEGRRALPAPPVGRGALHRLERRDGLRRAAAPRACSTTTGCGSSR